MFQHTMAGIHEHFKRHRRLTVVEGLKSCTNPWQQIQLQVTSPPSTDVLEMYVKMCLPKEMILEVLNAVQESLYF